MAKTSKKKLVIVISGVFVITVILIGVLLIKNHGQKVAPASEDFCWTNNGTLETPQCINDYLGLNADEAIKKAKSNGLYPKISKLDGKSLINTDEGSSAVYFEIEDNTITSVKFNTW